MTDSSRRSAKCFTVYARYAAHGPRPRHGTERGPRTARRGPGAASSRVPRGRRRERRGGAAAGRGDPAVVDCDRAGVFLGTRRPASCAPPAGHRRSHARPAGHAPGHPVPPGDARRDGADAPCTSTRSTDDPYMRGLMRSFGDLAILVIPVVARGTFLGVLSVGVSRAPRADLSTARAARPSVGRRRPDGDRLQNGQLIDRVTHQARQRRPDRTRQSRALRAVLRGCCVGAGAHRRRLSHGALLRRPGSLQVGQRRLRACRGRRAPVRGGRAAPG